MQINHILCDVLQLILLANTILVDGKLTKYDSRSTVLFKGISEINQLLNALLGSYRKDALHGSLL